jgi:putative addiction module component (TIGR02574 family)
MSDADRIYDDALRLPEDERAKLMALLADSLGAPDPHAALNDDELVDELERRADDAAAGRTTGHSWEHVKERVFGRRR